MEVREEVEDELTCVTSILDPETITITRSGSQVDVEVAVRPLTASDKDLAHVEATLVLSLGPEYPEEAPGVSIKRPRGLSEADVVTLTQEMITRSQDMAGCPLVFELVDLAREFLTGRREGTLV